MDFYPHNIGDFNAATRHLDLIDKAIYIELIWMYYDTEAPIPNDIGWVSKRILAKDQSAIVLNVLEEFFYLDDDLWKHDRCEAELAVFNTKVAQAVAAGKASGRARRKQAKKERTLNGRPTGPMVEPHNTQDTIHKTQNKDKAAKAASPPPAACPYNKIVDLYHEILPMCSRVKIMTNKRRSHLRARWANGADNLKFWKDYFAVVKTSPFLMGKTKPTLGRKVFLADFDFLIREDVVVQTQEGKYHERI